LKPDVNPSPTEVGSGSTASAHLDSGLAGTEGARRRSYLVRMIKPNSITSHDWHVQPICQRSFRVDRLSGLLWIEAQAFTGVSSNLLRSPISACKCGDRRFCANLLNLSKFDFHVNLDFPLFPLGYGPARLTSSLRTVHRNSNSGNTGKQLPCSKASHSAKYQRSTRQIFPSR
jgi:hypothetical protein